MGIRFPCHACNKRLNVKAFLAGKRGICPHCGTKVDIPWQSIDTEVNGTEAEASSIMPQSVATVAKPNGVHASPVDSTVPVAGSVAPAQSSVPMAVPTTPGAAPLSLESQGTAAGVAATPSAAPASSAVPIAKATVAPAPPQNDAPPNPIDEAPGAVWYVRPPSGGQYGPASGEIMKKWVGEGRVSADSLVWREGWSDWQTASSLFAELAGPSQTAAPPAGMAPPAPTTASPTAPYGGESVGGIASDSTAGRPHVKRRSNNSLAVIMVVLLTLASLGLFGVLIAVINWMQ